MYDTTIHARTIARRLTAADFIADKQLFDPDYRDQTIEDAIAVGRRGFKATPLKRSQLRGKNIYQFAELKDLLVARHLTENIRRITAVKQDNRQFIVECIKALMSEGSAFRVYKYDIKDFYESVVIQDILERLRSDIVFSGQTSTVISSLFDDLKSQGIHGLPRGLALSATLSEYLLRSFDRKILNHDDVWYYSRFVDDIIVVVNSNVDPFDFDRFSIQSLPSGLKFNKKSKNVLFSKWTKGLAKTQEGSFDFLGYNFTISTPYRDSNNGIIRDVEIDIAKSKVKRMKTRIARSLLRFRSDGNFDDLKARFQIVTSNFTFLDKKTKHRRVSGIYYNYPLVNFEKSKNLSALDKFTRAAVLSPHKNNVLRPLLSNKNRQILLRMTFRSGFNDKRFFHFSPERIAELRDCWKYV